VSQAKAFIYDLIALVAFIAIGHKFHGGSMNDLRKDTALPFVVGMLLGWVVGRVRNFRGSSVQFGLMVWGSTIFFGMGIRSMLGGDVPVAFIIVATVALGIMLLGWRLARTNLSRASA
jgi:hypothetical protein